jgi:hypothetical protein
MDAIIGTQIIFKQILQNGEVVPAKFVQPLISSKRLLPPSLIGTI